MGPPYYRKRAMNILTKLAQKSLLRPGLEIDKIVRPRLEIGRMLRPGPKIGRDFETWS